MKLFTQLHLKFLLIPLIILGSLLAVTFTTIFAITYSSTNKEIDTNIQEIAHTITKDSPTNNKGLYIYVYTNKDSSKTYETFNFNNFSQQDMDILINKALEGKTHISYKKHDFKVTTKTITNSDKPLIVYILIDCTNQYSTLSTLGSTLLTVYFVSIIIIAGLSYMLAQSATKPVKEAFEKERDLVANASHELKTPLTVAKTNLDLVVSDPSLTIQENLKWIESARYQIDRMSSLILQMLEFTKMEQKDYKPQKSILNISSLIEGIILSFEAGCYENGVRFASNIQPDITYHCDKVEIEKLVTILIDNALKYTPKNGEISVLLAKTLKYITIKVTNTGEGIPQEKIEKIFNRFYKLDESHKESGTSFGLGLSIAKLITESMNGSIKCESELGKYTTFEVILPV